MRVRLSGAGSTRVEALVSCGRWSDAAEPFWAAPAAAPPDLPPLTECPRAPSPAPTGTTVGCFGHVASQPDPATVTWAVGEPAGRAEVRGWLLRDDGAGPSLRDLVVFADALPPVTFDLGLFPSSRR